MDFLTARKILIKMNEILKVILKDKRGTIMRVKEILENGTYRLIDGSVVTEEEIREKFVSSK